MKDNYQQQLIDLTPEYAYKTIGEYEDIVGFKVNFAFETGWTMARTTMDTLRQITENSGRRRMKKEIIKAFYSGKYDRMTIKDFRNLLTEGKIMKQIKSIENPNKHEAMDEKQQDET